MGYKKVLVMPGGWADWVSHKCPIEVEGKSK